MPELRPYQQKDVETLSKLQKAACFNEPRTGKTPTILKTIEKLNCKKVIIVCPASTMLQWKKEYETWLNKPCVVISGTPTQKQKLVTQWKHGLIINYEALKTTKKGTGFVETLLSQNPDTIVVDEAHRIKNYKSANAMAIFAFSKLPYKFALTGTPAPNAPEEVWSILHFLYPEQYKSYWKFIDEYFNKSQISLPGRPMFIQIKGFQSKTKAYELQLKIDAIATNRKRKDVMPWLPKKDITNVFLEPTKAQTKYLEELHKFYETEHIITQGVLDRLIRYRQICLDPGILELKGTSPKTEWLKQFIKDYPNKPILIFSKFTTYLQKLTKELKLTNNLIIGETPIKTRQTRIDAFQNGKINQLLINIDAGNTGLTLDRAEAIVFTDKYPPVGDIEQAEDRFIATTKEKSNKAHTIYNLILKDTYDQQIYEMIKQKKSMIDIINDYKKYLTKE